MSDMEDKVGLRTYPHKCSDSNPSLLHTHIQGLRAASAAHNSVAFVHLVQHHVQEHGCVGEEVAAIVTEIVECRVAA